MLWRDVGQGLQRKKEMQEGCRRVGGYEQEGGVTIGMPTANNDDDRHTLWATSRQLNSASISHKILAIPPPWLLSPPTLTLSNIGLPHMAQYPYTPKTHASPILWVGDYDSVFFSLPQGCGHHASAHHPDTHHFSPVPPPTRPPVQQKHLHHWC